MPAKSLSQLTILACIKKRRELVSVQHLPYSVVKPILDTIESPSQLRVIETNSPQLQGDDAELWKKFIARDVPDWKKKNYVPRNPADWYKVYRRYMNEQEEDIAKSRAELQQTLAGLQKVKNTHVTHLVPLRSLPKMPFRKIPGVPLAGKKRSLVFKKDLLSSLVFSAGSKTKNIVDKAKREAQDMAARSRLSQPTHKLRIGRVKNAPTGMVDEYRRAAEPRASRRVFNPERESVKSLSSSGRSLEEREKKLRALTTQKRPVDVTQTVVDSSDDMQDLFGEVAPQTVIDLYDSEDNTNSVDDIFNEKPRRASPPASSRSIASSKRSQPSPFATSKTQSKQFRTSPSTTPNSKSKPTRPAYDMISHMLDPSKPLKRLKPTSTPTGTPPARPSQTDRSPPLGPNKSATPPSQSDMPTMIIRKRKEVDCFNRKVKKVRRTA